jgi:hypothetical protein
MGDYGKVSCGFARLNVCACPRWNHADHLAVSGRQVGGQERLGWDEKKRFHRSKRRMCLAGRPIVPFSHTACCSPLAPDTLHHLVSLFCSHCAAVSRYPIGLVSEEALKRAHARRRICDRSHCPLSISPSVPHTLTARFPLLALPYDLTHRCSPPTLHRATYPCLIDIASPVGSTKGITQSSPHTSSSGPHLHRYSPPPHRLRRRPASLTTLRHAILRL